jgi:hypothetical protein
VNRSSIAVRRLVPLVLVALAAGTIAAQADNGGDPKLPPSVPAPAPAVVTVAAAAPTAVALAATAPPPAPVPLPAGAPSAVWGAFTCAPTKGPTTAGAPPSQALLNAFGILRRERRPEDAMPAEALAALKRANLAPVAPESARLLRATADGGRAWVVPVPDVTRGFTFPCPAAGKFARPGAKPVPRTATPAPREGLAVVALGGAAAGGGGALNDLVRGRAPVAVDQCAGKGHDMFGVSGIVPEGVAAVFLTAPDGTAVKADVKDNGYEFLIPRPRTVEQRYVVWTGGDGTPHVQPVAAIGGPRLGPCARVGSLAKLPQITPNGAFGPCPVVLPAAAPVPAPALRRDKRGHALRVPLQRQVRLMSCVVSGSSALVAPAPIPPSALPVPRPRKHR